MAHLFLWTLLAVIVYCDSANILVVIPFTSRSHYIYLRPIGLQLARRGHNVTVITANKETNHPPTYHEIMVEKKEIWELSGNGERPNVFDMVDLPSHEFHKLILWEGGTAFTEHALKSPEVQKFLAVEQTFDAVIAEQFYFEALYILAHKYKAPLILATTFGNCMRHNFILKNPLQQATVVSEFIKVEDPTSFWGRLWNFCFSVYEFVNFKYSYLNNHEELVKKYVPNLQEPVPSLFEIEKNASLTLYNGHFSFDPPTAYIPNIVEVGGLHLTMTDDGNIPKDLQRILDDAADGVIYVNFGSNVRSSELPESKVNAFVNVFRKLKQTVLWKWEDDKLKNIPKNLIIRKWFPQKEILSHPKIKVFISHGGLIGTQEAIFHGVPIIGVPIYADQYNNLLQIQNLGVGKILQYKDINENTLQEMVLEVIKNNSYEINSKELSRRFKDRPMSALDTALFWIEYVIRNKGAEFMKNPARNLHWLESSMIDVYVFVIVVPVTISLILIGSLIRLANIIAFSSNKDTSVREKKKK